MSSKIKGLIVTFEHDLSDEHADKIINAIRLIKYVADAKPIQSNYNDIMNREQVKAELRSKFIKFYDELK